MLLPVALVALALYVVWGFTALRRSLARTPFDSPPCWTCLEEPCSCDTRLAR